MTISFSRHAIAVACLSGVFPATLLAQTPAVSVLPDIVVTASRTHEPLADVVGDVSVIGPKQLAEARGDSVIDILARTPGVQISTNGGPQTVSSLFLRGTNTTHALILIDGMRINGSSSGTVNFAAIDPAMLERIEVLRGAASSLYGSDAIGGVINLVTKKVSRTSDYLPGPMSAMALTKPQKPAPGYRVRLKNGTTVSRPAPPTARVMTLHTLIWPMANVI